MSTYKILLSKNSITSQVDENISIHDDSTVMPDTTVTCWVNYTNQVAAATVTDTGGCLMFDYDMPKESANATNVITVQTTAGDPTDVHIDRIVIDDDNIVASQFKMETRIFGSKFDTSPRKYATSYLNHKDSSYVWWGKVFTGDTEEDRIKRHRPHLISDTGQRWEWHFSVTDSGHLYWEHRDEASASYDSTAWPYWYAAKKTFEYDDSTVLSYDSAIGLENDSVWNPGDSANRPSWHGAGVYGAMEGNLGVFQDSALASEFEDSSATVLYTMSEWYEMLYNSQYLTKQFEPVAKTVTTA